MESREWPGTPGRPMVSCTREGECAVAESLLFSESTDSFALFSFLEGSASEEVVARGSHMVVQSTKYERFIFELRVRNDGS